MNFIIRILITAAVAYGLTKVLSGVHISNFTSAILFAILLAVLNAFIKPILVFLTLPITIVTLGLFLLVINTLIILLSDKLMDSMVIDGFWWAMLFSILLSIITSILSGLFSNDRSR
ncbi:MAG: phage holin family protein [Ferruginibacter sp.]